MSSTEEQTTINTHPVSLHDFLYKLRDFAKKNQWVEFRKAVSERKQWFESRGMKGKF